MPPSLLRRRERTPDGTTVDQDFLRECADFPKHRAERYRLYEEMYDGLPRTRLTDRQKAYLEASGVRWSENFIETIINVTNERMNVTGFAVEDREDVADWLTRRAWGRNGMDAKQSTVHIQTMVKADGYILVTPGPDGTPRYQWNKPELHKPVYDDDGELLYDIKRWPTSKLSKQNPKGQPIWRLNLYFPDRVEKYFSLEKDSKSWATWMDDGDESWPVWWTENRQEDGEPLGVCVVPFRNQPLGRDYGRSDVKGLIPFQHGLEKQLLDLFDVSDSQGWPQRWATGSTGEEGKNIVTNPGEVWLGPEGGRFGQFDPANPEGPLAAINGTLHRMAAYARIPLHVFLMEGTIPSGESLKTANSPLVKKANDRKLDAGSSWATVARLGWRVGDAFGAPDCPAFDEDVQVTTLWDSSEDRNETAELTNAGLKQDLGVSRTTSLRELGYDPKEEAELVAKERAAAGPPPPMPGDDLAGAA